MDALRRSRIAHFGSLAIAATFLALGWLLLAFGHSFLLLYWVAAAVVGGSAIAVLDNRRLVLARLKWLIIFYMFFVVESVWTTQNAARQRTAAAHLKYVGAAIQKSDSIRIGTDSTADFHFPATTNLADAWELLLVRDSTHWRIATAVGQQIRVYPGLADMTSNSFSLVNGVKLGDNEPIYLLREGKIEDTLVPSRRAAELELTSRRLRATLFSKPANSRIASVWARKALSGIALSEFEGKRSHGEPFERFVWLQRIHEPFGTDNWVASASNPYKVSKSPTVSAEPPLPDSSRIEVRSGATLWRFGIMRYANSRRLYGGLAIRFYRNPRPLDVALPTRNTCGESVPCGIVSLNRMPMPIPSIWFGAAGVSPVKYSMLGRAESESDHAVLVTARARIPLRGDSGTYVPVQSLSNSPDSVWVELQSATGLGAGVSDTLVTTIFPFILLGLALWYLSRRAPLRITGRALALAVNAVLGLLSIRLILGSRITFFPPENAQGLETAIGLWVAVVTSVCGIAFWPHWAPRLIHAFYQLFKKQPQSLKWTDGLPILLVGGGVALAYYLASSPPTVALVASSVKGVLVGAAAVASWFLLAWVVGFSSEPVQEYQHVWSVVSDVSNASAGQLPGSWLTRFFLSGRSPVVMLVVAAFAGAKVGEIVCLAAALLGAMLLVYLWFTNDRRTALRRLTYVACGLSMTAVVFGALKWYSQGPNGPVANLTLVVLIALSVVRIGRTIPNPKSNFSAVWPILFFPGVLLLSLPAIDMGLLLVVLIPVLAAIVFAAGWDRMTWLQRTAWAIMFITTLLATKRVVSPDLNAISAGQRSGFAAEADAFDRLTPLRPIVSRWAPLRDPFERAAARAVATFDEPLAEDLIIAARPGAASELLIPSIEQIWGARSYAAQGGALGRPGFGNIEVGNSGIAEAVSYAENTFAVYVLGESGFLAGVGVLLLYCLLALAIATIVWRMPSHPTDHDRTVRALIMVSTLLLLFPASYVALSNVALVPITGQNMPFLGLNAWSDVVLCSGCVGILVTGLLQMLDRNQLA